MKNTKFKKVLVALTSASLVAAFTVLIPTSAKAADLTCVSAGTYKTCKGTDEQGAAFEIRMPSKFNGTFLLWNHGYRYNINLPAIPVVAPAGYVVNKAAEVAPSEVVAGQLLKQGYAIGGSSYATQGWAAESAVITDLALINLVKSNFPKVSKVVAWGNSLGGFVTQSLSEQFPYAIDAAAPLCTASGSIEGLLTYAGDALWIVKQFFDSSIKGSGYSAGLDGYKEAVGDIGKVLQVANALKIAIGTNPTAPAWPATSTVPDAMKAIPSRSAVLMAGLLAGVPTQSNTFDASSGPKGPLETSFGLVISPALAVLENIAESAILGVIVSYDLELQGGGTVYDNTKTNYVARLGDNADVFAAGLSGAGIATTMVGYLQLVAPKVKADADAIGKLRLQYAHTGDIKVPTIFMTGLADPITTPGNTQLLLDKYSALLGDGKSKVVTLWNKTPEEYTTFSAAGLPETPSVKTPGTGHCNFTTSQYLLVAKLAANAAKTGSAPSAKTVAAAIKNEKYLFVDPEFKAPLLKFYAN
jgi:pimeloyl-ACP methyl ester carboxylesterase